MTYPCKRIPHARLLPPMPPCPICHKIGVMRICTCCGAGADVPSCHERHIPDVPATIGPEVDNPGWSVCDDCACICPTPRPVRTREVCLPTGSRARRKHAVAFTQGDLFREVGEADQLDLFSEEVHPL